MPQFRDLEPRVWVYGIDPLGAASDTLVLGHATRGRIGAAAGNKLATKAQSDGVVDITAWVDLIQTNQGKSRSLDTYGAGQCSLELDCTDRRFDPFYTAGAYGFTPVIAPASNLFCRGKRLKVVLVQTSAPTVAEFDLWSGFIDVVDVQFSEMISSTLSRSRVSCVDAFDVLGRFEGTELVEQGAGEGLGQRIRRILSRARWLRIENEGAPYATFTLGDVTLGRIGAAYDNHLSGSLFDPVDTTATSLTGMEGYGATGGNGSAPLQATTMTQNALAEIKAAADSEGGQVFVNRAGAVQWTVRADWGAYPIYYVPSSVEIFFCDTDLGTVSVVAGATGATWTTVELSVPFSGPTFAFDTGELVTYVSATKIGDGSVAVVREDVVAQDKGVVAWNRTDLICQSDTDVATVADRVLLTHKDVVQRMAGLTVWPQHSNGAMRAAATVELEDHVRVRLDSKGIDRFPVVIGIQHAIRPKALGGWTTQFTITEAGG